MIIYKIQKFWDENGFNILLGFAIIFLIVYGLTRIGSKGTYGNNSKDSYIPQSSVKITPQISQISQISQFPSSEKESKLERECRKSLHEIFKKPFHKARPDFLRNPVTQNFNLELDCFNPELRLAIEANGIQHYKFTPYFHKNKDAFQNQQYRDELKRRMCKDNNINLIEVPYTIKEIQIKEYILNKCRQLGYNV